MTSIKNKIKTKTDFTNLNRDQNQHPEGCYIELQSSWSSNQINTLPPSTTHSLPPASRAHRIVHWKMGGCMVG